MKTENIQRSAITNSARTPQNEIKVKNNPDGGSTVTFSGRANRDLMEAARSAGLTEQEYFDALIEKGRPQREAALAELRGCKSEKERDAVRARHRAALVREESIPVPQ